MFAITSKPKRFSLGDDFVEGSSVGGRIIYLDSSTSHGVIISPYWYDPFVSQTDLLLAEDGYVNGYGPYQVPTEGQFNDYVRPMINGTATDYLPWNEYSGWPTRANMEGKNIWMKISGKCYQVTQDRYVYQAASVLNAGMLIRFF